jgi:hypothetical protein
MASFRLLVNVSLAPRSALASRLGYLGSPKLY